MVLFQRRSIILLLLAGLVGAGLWSWKMGRAERARQMGSGDEVVSSTVVEMKDGKRSGLKDRSEGGDEVYPEIDALLRDEGRDEAETGLALLERAMEKSLSIGERRVAMEHALLLLGEDEGPQLLAAAANRELPDELAEMLGDSLMNYDDPLRLQGALELSRRHSGQAMNEAVEMLQFLMDGDDEESLADLQRRAEERLSLPEE